MKVIMKPSSLSGTIIPPPSKSYSHRAIIIGMCSGHPVNIHDYLPAGDVFATIRGCEQLGTIIEKKTCQSQHNLSLHLPTFHCDPITIDAQKSGTTLRFLLGVASTQHQKVTLTGHHTLLNRPVGPLVDALRSLGTQLEYLNIAKYPPVRSEGGRQGGIIHLPSLMSSQYISSLLLSSPLVKGRTQIIVDPPKSLPYLLMTHEVLREFGYEISLTKPNPHKLTFTIDGQKPTSPRSTPYQVPKDWSSGAMILTGGAISGKTTITGLSHDQQGDQVIVDILQAMNASITQTTVRKELSISAENNDNKLNGITWNCKNIPDLVPVIAVLGSAATGITRITGAEHLRLKESNRLDTLAHEFQSLHINVEPTEDGLLIKGPNQPYGEAQSHGDHRLAMSLTLLGLISPKSVTVHGTECIQDSYPGFIKDLQSLGVNINEYAG